MAGKAPALVPDSLKILSTEIDFELAISLLGRWSLQIVNFGRIN